MPPQTSKPQTPLWRRLFSPFALIAMALALFWTRPDFNDPSRQAGDAGTMGCLSNLEQIGRAYALYARDYDDKFPRGTDPEDHYYSEIWNEKNSEFGGRFYNDAQTAPLLHLLLKPYTKNPEVWHCPADVGWKQSRIHNNSDLPISPMQNIFPSSFARFGTSYYVLTRYNFNLLTASDLPNPGQTLLLFDGDLWHLNNGKPTMNGLFADGSSRNITGEQFRNFLNG